MLQHSDRTANGLVPAQALEDALQIVLRRGLDLREKGDLDGAAECFERCLELSRAIDSPALEANALACQGTLALLRGQTGEARQAFASALAIRTRGADAVGQARALNDLAQCDTRSGQVGEALDRLHESLVLTAGVPPGRTRAESLELLGRIHRDRGELKEALRMLEEALEMRQGLGDRAGIATNLDAIGMVYHRMTRPQEAFDHLLRAFEIRRSLEDRRAISVTANNLALVHFGQGHLDEAEALLGDALAGFRSVSDRVGMAHAHTNMGLVFSEQGRMDQARERHEESLRIREELHDIPGQANSLNNLSFLSIEQGRLLEAICFAERAIELRKQAGLAGAIAKPLYNQGRACLEFGRADEARRLAAEVARLAVESGSAESEIEGRLLLAEIHIQAGEMEEAAQEAERARSLTVGTKDPRLIASALRVMASVRFLQGSPDSARELLLRAERTLRGRGPSTEIAAIHRDQGRLAASAGATQSAVERLQKAAAEFEAIGNRGAQARCLAVLARALHETAPEEAMLTWNSAEEIARASAELECPVDLGPPLRPTCSAVVTGDERGAAGGPAGGSAGDAAVEPALQSVGQLLRNLRAAESLARLGSWLAELRRVLRARAVGFVTAGADRSAMEAGEGIAHPLADGRVLWAPPDQDREAEALLLTCEPGNPPESVIVELIEGTDGACWIGAAGASHEGARPILQIVAILLQQRPFEEIRPIGDPEIDGPEGSFEGLVGISTAMRSLYRKIERVARSNVSVLIMGESGTGKELVARAIHARSRRATGPFVPINCPSIPRELIEAELFGHEKGAYTGATMSRPGKVELADGGSLFLDEVGDMDLATQSKLLRFLQERELQRVGGRETLRVDVRVLAATSRDLGAAMEAGNFRTDLFYRLNVVPLVLPPLCDRREDIPGLIRHFLRQLETETARQLTITPAALVALRAHLWPGNVRELRNTLAHMAALAEGSVLDTRQLPPSIPRRPTASAASKEPALENGLADSTLPLRPGETLRDRLLGVEADLIRKALEAEGGNQSAAARRLGITGTMIRNRIRMLSIQPTGPHHRQGRMTP